MDSIDFFIFVSGIYKDAAEAFAQAIEEADESTFSISGKSNCVEIKVPNETDPIVFAKKLSIRHGNDFWNFVDGPAACVEIKGKWLEANRPENTMITKGFKMFIFFGLTYSIVTSHPSLSLGI